MKNLGIHSKNQIKHTNGRIVEQQLHKIIVYISEGARKWVHQVNTVLVPGCQSES